MKNKILLQVYLLSAIVVTVIMMLLSFVFKWSPTMMGVTVAASLFISVPSTISLHFIFWFIRKVQANKIFLWMVLLASIPLLSLLPAELFADFLPGDAWFIILTGIVAAYTSIFSYGISIAQIFNSSENETR